MLHTHSVLTALQFPHLSTVFISHSMCELDLSDKSSVFESPETWQLNPELVKQASSAFISMAFQVRYECLHLSAMKGMCSTYVF